MSFLETVARARAFLERDGRISLRGLQLEFGLDDDQLEALVGELVDVQQVAAREGKALAWLGAATPATTRGPEPAAPGEGEHRQLTVMFCDLVDSTELAARMGPEDWHELVQRFQRTCAGVVDRFAGHVAQYLGDGLLVYFGYPFAHEDDAERAVRASLGIVAALDELNAELAREGVPTLSSRIGIHTGPVVVGEVGGLGRRERLALGDTANIAARLQGLAEPDSVVLSHATLRLVQGIFRTRDLGTRELKGVREPMRVHRAIQATGMRSRMDLEAATGLTPLVGREQELALLDDRWAQVREGAGHAAMISGEAGIGKSRLVQAFRQHLADRSHTWLECRCSPYTQESALQPVLELQRQVLGLEREETPDTQVERLAAGLRASGFDLTEALPLLASFHSLPLPDGYEEPMLSPEARRRRTLDLMVEWLLRLGRDQAVVLMMEDLHWMDPSTLELLGAILDRLEGAHVLLLCTYRPDFEPPWGARPNLTPLLVARLTRPQMRDLILKTAERSLPDRWVDEIVRRADGVPLFGEELTRTVLETHSADDVAAPAGDLRIPETLQDSLMARLDALGPVKELAQVAAVLGREFSYELLLAVSPLTEDRLRRSLEDAVREELFYQRGTPPDATFLFKHALIRDAAYTSLLRSTRRRHHGRVAETLLERLPALVESQPELVAHHLTEAGEHERAIAWWLRAGERANGRTAHREAVLHLRRGLAVLANLPEGGMRDGLELDLQIAIGRGLRAALGWAHQETGEAWARAEALCDAPRDPLRAMAIFFGAGADHLSRGDPRTAMSFGRKLAAIEHAGEEIRIATRYLAGAAHWYLGEFAAAGRELGELTDRYAPDEIFARLQTAGLDVGPGPHCYAAWNDWCFGRPDRAWRTILSVLEGRRRERQPFTLVATLSWAGVLAIFRRDYDSALRFGAETAEVGQAQGFAQFEAIGRLVRLLGEEAGRGDPAAADAFAATMAQAAGTGNRGAAPIIVSHFVGLLLRAGRLEQAAGMVAGGLAVAAETGQVFFDAELHRLRGEIAAADGQPEAAEASLGEALGIARRQQARGLELRAATSLARLWHGQGRADEARSLLAPVLACFDEGRGERDLRDAETLLDG